MVSLDKFALLSHLFQSAQGGQARLIRFIGELRDAMGGATRYKSIGWYVSARICVTHESLEQREKKDERC